MPMTRELKKRFMSVEDRIEKLEKRKPSQRTNGADPLVTAEDETDTRLDNIEAVLQIPGEKVGDVQVLSAWRDIIESKLIAVGEKLKDLEGGVRNIKKILVIPGPDGFLSGFANKVDTVLTDLKGRVQKVEQVPDPSATVLEFDERLKKMETPVRDLKTRDRHLTQEMNDNRPIIKDLCERLNTLETKPVAGALSQVTGKMVEEIEGNTREMKELKARNSLVHLLLLAVTILLFGISLLT